MGASPRKTRNYKEKSSMFAFGHIALPLAAIIAVGLLFVGIKLFFLSPAEEQAVEIRPSPQQTTTVAQSTPQPQQTAAVEQPVPQPSHESQSTQTAEITLARPVDQSGAAKPEGTQASSGGSQRQQSKPAAQSQPKPQTSTSKPAQSNAQAAPRAGSASFGVQIGAFTRKEGADVVANDARKLGYSPVISSVTSSGKTFHRVRIPVKGSRDAAAKLAAELEKKGFTVAVVANP